MLEEDRRHPTLAELPTHGNPSGASARRHTAVSSEHYKPKADVQELTAQHTPVHVEHLSACKTYSIPATGAHGSTLEASVPHAFRVQQSLSSGELSPSGFQEVDGSDSDGSNHICRRPLPKWTMMQQWAMMQAVAVRAATAAAATAAATQEATCLTRREPLVVQIHKV